MADSEKAIGSNYRIFLACAGLLIVTGLWRVFIPASEYNSTSAVWFGVVVDGFLILGLVGLYRQLSASLDPQDSRRGVMTALFWPGLVAGVVVFAIRLTSPEGWWTGHLRYAVG